MKLSLNWLADYIDLPTDEPQQIADALESLGHEVEAIESLAPAFRGVIVGKVLEVGPHPDADMVRLCQVDLGGEVSEIICGAWNFEAGAVVAVAVPGSVLGEDFEIGRRKIRGIVSNGMICSETELGIGEDADGILVLSDEYPDVESQLGADVSGVLGLPDTVLDIAITPNRPDCMSVVGLARELGAYFEVEVRTPGHEVEAHEPASVATVRIDDPDRCPRFVAREVRNITVGASPLWMRMRLSAAGMRPINNVVDISNYVMMEVGHPTHAFDLDRLGDTVVVRRATTGEQITTLDDEDRALIDTDIVVADAETPVAIAGVMGGASTEVQDSTQRVLIEAAYWNPPSILSTSKRLVLRSEASARFERGMDPNACHIAADRVAGLLAAHAGGEVAAGLIDVYPTVIEPGELSLSLAEVPRHLGIELDATAVSALLERLGFATQGVDPITVTVPTRRPDVGRSIDLIEEIARLHGFDHIPERFPAGEGGGLPVDERSLRAVRRSMVGAGYHEVLNFSFIGANDLDGLGLDADDPRRDAIRVVNPLRDEEGVMRTTLLPGLLRAVAVNRSRRVKDAALFETGKVFHRGEGPIPDQPDRLGFVAVGGRGGDWDGPGREVDVRDAVGVVELLAERWGLDDLTVTASAAAPLHPGRGAEISSGGDHLGHCGELHPRAARSYGLEGRVVIGEIDLAPFLEAHPPWQFVAPSSYPPVVFDLAFEIEPDVPAGTLLRAVHGAGVDEVEDVEIFDVFSGAPLTEGQRSVAIRLTLRAQDHTMTDEEVAPLRRHIVEAVTGATGGKLRGEA